MKMNLIKYDNQIHAPELKLSKGFPSVKKMMTLVQANNVEIR